MRLQLLIAQRHLYLRGRLTAVSPWPGTIPNYLGYDAPGRVTPSSGMTGWNEFLNVSLSWYANGNLSAATFKNGGAAANNGGIGYPQFLAFTQTFTYDTVNRLQTATDTGGWSRNYYNYYYDAYGKWRRAEAACRLI